MKDPIFDSIVALIFIHFGIFDVTTTDEASHGCPEDKASSKRRLFAQLLKQGRVTQLITERRHRKTVPLVELSQRRSLPRAAALSVDALIAVTELCLQGVFSSTLLCDILVLFSLGDVENDFCEVTDDTELLRAFLRDGLLPRSAAIRARFGEADPIGDVAGMLKTVGQLRDANKPGVVSSSEHVMSRSSSSVFQEQTDWIALKRFPSHTVSRWSKLPQPLPRALIRDELTRAQKPANMLDVLNGHTTALE